MELAAFLARLFAVLGSAAGPGQQRNCESDYHATSPPAARSFTILVEGNVGCGKTTTLEYFRSQPVGGRRGEVDILVEPVEKWRNISGVDLLQNIAEDANRWGGVFQMYSSLTRYENALKPTSARLRLMERSIFSERYCFLEACHAARHRPHGKGISDPEYLLMDMWFKTMTENLWEKLRPDLILYIRCDVPVLLERIKKRGRPEEAHIPVDFLQDIQQRHDDWLIHKNSTFPVPAKVMVLNGNLPIDQYKVYLEKHRHEIMSQVY